MQGNPKLSWALGLGIGAGVMYFSDPQRAGKRRALVRDKLKHLGHESVDILEVGSRDLMNRAKGIAAETRSAIRRNREVDDEILIDRIRSKIGRVASHPHAIEVESRKGRVLLRGLVLAHELDRLLSTIGKVDGVKQVESRLESASSLQGGTPRAGEQRLDVLQTSWAPGTRLLVGLSGGGLVAYGLVRRGPVGSVLAGTGLLALSRSAMNHELKRFFGTSAGRNAISIRKTVHIEAPTDRVFAFWSCFESFPGFMTEVKRVQVSDDRRTSHWRVRGPLGIPVSFACEITKAVPNQLLAWRSLPGELIRNAGQVKFIPCEHGGTKIELDFTYNPPGGAFGHLLNKLFGSDPKRRIEISLAEMKQLVERGPSQRQIQAL